MNMTIMQAIIQLIQSSKPPPIYSPMLGATSAPVPKPDLARREESIGPAFAQLCMIAAKDAGKAKSASRPADTSARQQGTLDEFTVVGMKRAREES